MKIGLNIVSSIAFFLLFFFVPALAQAAPVIGVAKDASKIGREIIFHFYIENYGDEDLETLVLDDDLDAVFGAGNYTITSAPSFVDNPGTIVLNGGFDGDSDTSLITSGTLAQADTAQIQITVEINTPVDLGSGLGVYTNQVTVSAAGSPSGTPTSDLSDWGTDPDPSGNGYPGDAGEDDSTDVSLFANPIIGAAKMAGLYGTQATFVFYLENFGNVELIDLSLTDDLDTVFGAGNYSIISGPALLDDPGTITVNAGFDGSSDIELIASGTLTLADTASIAIVVDITTVTDQGAGLGVYSNQAIASAQDSYGNVTADDSDQGLDPDPNGDGTPGGVDEADPTLVVAGEEPTIGLAKTAVVSDREVTLNLFIENLGNVTLENLSLTDDLDAVFGAGMYFFTSEPSFVGDPGSLTLSTGFNGSSDTELLAGGTLSSGDTAQIAMTLEVFVSDQGLGEGVYQNQAEISGQSPGGSLSIDFSDAGSDPDPNGNGNPFETDENDPTQFSIVPQAVIGAAVSYTLEGTGNTVVIRYDIHNLGNVTLSNITIDADLDAVFGAGNFVHFQDPQLRSGATTLSYNAAYNGSTNIALLSGGTLDAGEKVSFTTKTSVITVTDQGYGYGIYQHQVTVNATDPDAASVSDLSDSGTDPDSNDNGVANETGENDPTEIVVEEDNYVGAAQDVSVIGNSVTFDVYLESFSSADFTSVSLTSNLNSVFGAGNYVISSSPVFIIDPGTVTINPSFDGSVSEQDIIEPASTLSTGDRAHIQFAVDVLSIENQGLGIGSFSSQVFATAITTGSNTLTDDSDFGTDPDPDSNDDPTENGENDPTTFSIATDTVVGAGKTAAVSGSQVTLDFYLENFGSETALDVTLTDNLDDVFGSGNYSITTAPVFIVDPGTLVLNGVYNGGTESSLLGAGSTLNAGATAQIQMVLNITNTTDNQGLGHGVYENQATVTATDTSGLNFVDTSDDNVNPDSNDDDDPTEEETPTSIIVGDGSIGIANHVKVNGTSVTFDIYIENLGSLSLTNINVNHSLNAVFGAGNYSITTSPSQIAGTGSITPYSNFNGNSFPQLVVDESLDVGEWVQLQYVVNVTNVTDHQGKGSGIYSLQLTATADDATGASLSDLSDSGIYTDANGNGLANDTNEDDPTIIVIGEEPQIGVAKNVSTSVNQVTFDLYLETFGNVSLQNVSLIENLDAVFGAGNYSINGSPSIIDDPGTITLNVGYDGSSVTELLDTGSTLNIGDTAQIRIVVDVTNLSDVGFGFGSYQNQVSSSAVGPGGSLTFDTSDNGTDPDPDGNGDPSDTEEADVTTFSLSSSEVGIAKTATVTSSQVTFDYYIENLGSSTLSNFSVNEGLDAVFGAGNYEIIVPATLISSPRNLIVNLNFDGSTDTQLIQSGTIDGGITEHIQVVVNVTNLVDMGSGLGVYSNQVTVTANDPGMGALSDLSDDGTDPDPDGNGDPSNAGENDPTTFTVPEVPVIGVAKNVSVLDSSVTMDFYLENFGNTLLNNLVLNDNLNTVFGADNYTIISGPTLLDDPGTVTVNSGFNGNTDIALIASGTLACNDTALFRVIVSVHKLTDQGPVTGVYTNQVNGSGQSPDGTAASDLSDAGTDPDPNGNGDPTGTGEDDATIFSITESPVIGVAKSVVVTQNSLVIFDFYLENFGNVDLSSLSLTDDLDSVFGAGKYTIFSSPVFIDDPGTISLNSGFNGSGNTSLISSGTLVFADTAQIRVEVEVPGGKGSFFNSATVSAQAPSSTTVNDISTSGTDPDPNGNGNPADTGEDEMTRIIFKGFPWMMFTHIFSSCPVEPDFCYVIADEDNIDHTNSSLLKYIFHSNTLELVNRLGVNDVEASAFSLDGRTLYATDNGVLGTIDTTPGNTNSFTVIEPAGVGVGNGVFGAVSFNDIDGLSFDPESGILYGSVITYTRSTGFVDLLIQLDPQTGKYVTNGFGQGRDYVPIVLPVTNVRNIDDIAFDREGQLYGVVTTDNGANQIVTINKATGTASLDVLVVAGNIDPVGDIEGLTLYRDMFYGSTGTTGDNANGLYRFDKETGSAELIIQLNQDFNGDIPGDFEAIGCYPVCR